METSVTPTIKRDPYVLRGYVITNSGYGQWRALRPDGTWVTVSPTSKAIYHKTYQRVVAAVKRDLAGR